MTHTLNIQYQETAFTIPWERNLQAIHDRVYQVLLEGRHVSGPGKTRTFVFDVLPMDADAGIGLVVARGLSFPDSIVSEPKQLAVQVGSRFTVRARLSPIRQIWTDRDDRKKVRAYRALSNEEVPNWCCELLERNGMRADSAVVLSTNQWPVYKSSDASFGVTEARIEADVSVTEPALFVKAFLGGVGRHKGYGFGMLEVTK